MQIAGFSVRLVDGRQGSQPARLAARLYFEVTLLHDPDSLGVLTPT